MKKIIFLLFPILAACTIEPNYQWEQYIQVANATAYVDITASEKMPESNIKRSSLLINYAETDIEGTHSAIISFVLDCTNKMVRIDHFTSYKQLNGQGEIIADDTDPEIGFKPLSEFLGGEQIHILLCSAVQAIESTEQGQE